MVGVDDHAYSDYALKWLLDSLVDDGDEVVCVRVIENPAELGKNPTRRMRKRSCRGSRNGTRRTRPSASSWSTP